MLFIMRGTSCSGKDAFLRKTFGENNPHILSSDELRVMLAGDEACQDYNRRIFSILEEMVETRLLQRAAYTVINATNLRMKDVRRFTELAKKHHSSYTFISIQPPSVEELVRRSKQRGTEGGLETPENVLAKHFDRYETCKKSFIDEATYNERCTFIEIDQENEVIRYVN